MKYEVAKNFSQMVYNKVNKLGLFSNLLIFFYIIGLLRKLYYFFNTGSISDDHHTLECISYFSYGCTAFASIIALCSGTWVSILVQLV